MNWIFKIAPLLLLICLKHVDVEGTKLKIRYKDGDDIMTITCLPRLTYSSAWTFLNIKLIRKQYSDVSSSKDIVSAAPTKHIGEAELVDKSLEGRAHVTGKADNDNKSGSFLKMVLNPVICEDSGIYVCATSFMFTTPDVTVDIQSIFITSRCHCSQYCSTDYKQCFVCKPGFFGPTCQNKCDTYSYGENCLKKCNCLNSTEICDPKTGYCTTGCSDEWTGASCDLHCHCSEGCEGHMKECQSCVFGYRGKYCQDAWPYLPYLLAASISFVVSLIAVIAICCRSKKKTTEVIYSQNEVPGSYDNPNLPKVENSSSTLK